MPESPSPYTQRALLRRLLALAWAHRLGCLTLMAIAVANEWTTRAPIEDALKFNRQAQNRVEEFVRNELVGRNRTIGNIAVRVRYPE